MQELKSDTVIEVSIEIPFPFQAIPAQTIESSGTQVLEQILKIMLPRFMAQACDNCVLAYFDFIYAFMHLQ